MTSSERPEFVVVLIRLPSIKYFFHRWLSSLSGADIISSRGAAHEPKKDSSTQEDHHHYELEQGHLGAAQGSAPSRSLSTVTTSFDDDSKRISLSEILPSIASQSRLKENPSCCLEQLRHAAQISLQGRQQRWCEAVVASKVNMDARIHALKRLSALQQARSTGSLATAAIGLSSSSSSSSCPKSIEVGTPAAVMSSAPCDLVLFSAAESWSPRNLLSDFHVASERSRQLRRDRAALAAARWTPIIESSDEAGERGPPLPDSPPLPSAVEANGLQSSFKNLMPIVSSFSCNGSFVDAAVVDGLCPPAHEHDKPDLLQTAPLLRFSDATFDGLQTKPCCLMNNVLLSSMRWSRFSCHGGCSAYADSAAAHNNHRPYHKLPTVTTCHLHPRQSNAPSYRTAMLGAMMMTEVEDPAAYPSTQPVNPAGLPCLDVKPSAVSGLDHLSYAEGILSVSRNS